MTSKLLRYFFQLYLLTIPFLAVAQKHDLNFLNLSTKEGLSSNVVNTIIKDHAGFIWFGTDDGLNRYDGQNFTVYRHRADDSSSIASNEILDLFEDESENLWIATGAGLVLYDREKDAFKNFAETQTETVTSVCRDKNNNIWIAHYEGITILNLKTGKFAPLRLSGKQDQLVVQRPVTDLFLDNKKQIWLGTSTGLYLYHPDRKSLQRFFNIAGVDSSLPSNYVDAISQDKQGNIWVGTNKGLSMLMPDKRGWINYYHKPNDKSSLSSNIVYSIAADSEGKLWIGTEEGLDILEPVKNKLSRVERNTRNRYSLVGKSVKSIFIDKQGIAWVATFRGGINKYNPNLAFFNLRESNRFDPFGLSAPVVTSFAESEKGKIYVGTDGGGLNLFNPTLNEFKHIAIPCADNGYALSILAMAKKDNELWMATYLNGVYVLNTSTGSCQSFKQGTISSNDVFCLKVDSRDNVWIGTNGQGLDYYNQQSKTFSHYNKDQKGKYKISTNGYIRAVEEDQEGNIWIGSNGSGIAVYNPLTGACKYLTKANSALPIDNITAINLTRSGDICIGTAGGGLTLFNTEKETMTTYSEDNGLANGVVYKIVEDGNGKLWLSTNKGLSSFDPVTKKFKNYSYYNGIQRSPFVLGSGLKLSNGMIFFGGTDGFNYFDPQQLKSNKSVPKLVFTDLKINNLSVKPAEDAPIQKDISIAKKIDLDYKQNFSLSFVALNYTSPQENRYFYKLENFDKEWNSVGQNNTAVYTNLDPGVYVFKVRAASDAGEWRTSAISIKVYVHPPFWLTYWAYAIYLLLILGILLFIRQRGIQKLRADFALEQERREVQQMIEQERREAERIHEFDQMKIKFLTNLSHEFRTPISLIMGPVEQLIQQETRSLKNQQLSMIKRNARRLLNLVNQLLDFRNIRDQEQRLQSVEADFVTFTRDVAESFKDLAERKNIGFSFTSELNHYFTMFDQDKIERVFFNLLSNAFKFTPKGGEVKFTINVALAKPGLNVSIEDSGIGMSEEVKDKIFDRFYQADSDPAILNQGSGIGLSIAKEFVRLHDGIIEVESIAGKGTVFNIYFPFIRIENVSILNDDDLSINTSEQELEDEEHLNIEPTVEPNLPVILLVEDNDDFRYYLKDNLKTYYRVVEASNGKEGWQKVLSAHPQLVVSDISMPQVSGIELCKKIKADKRTTHIPVILLTALTGEENQLIGLETGASDYMTKPFNFEILHLKIKNLLKLNEQLKDTYSKQLKVQAADVKIESENEKLLSKVLQFIESNLNNPQLSVEELSRHVGMSRGSLYTKILQVTGETPVEFIRSVKLDRAAALLVKSDMNVAQVCYSVGFATPNYFARAFKARFNMLPSEYIHLKRGER